MFFYLYTRILVSDIFLVHLFLWSASTSHTNSPKVCLHIIKPSQCVLPCICFPSSNWYSSLLGSWYSSILSTWLIHRILAILMKTTISGPPYIAIISWFFFNHHCPVLIINWSIYHLEDLPFPYLKKFFVVVG